MEQQYLYSSIHATQIPASKDNCITCLLVSPKKAPLPEEYTNVPPLVLPKNKAKFPKTNSALISHGDQAVSAMQKEHR